MRVGCNWLRVLNRFVVLPAGLITWLAPSYALRDDVSFSADNIEKQIAQDLLRHAQDLRTAFDHVKTDTKLSRSLQLHFAANHFVAACGIADSAVRELAHDEIQLKPVGKLAKSGDFFASADSRWLVKAVSSGEKSKLKELGNFKAKQTEHSAEFCSAFNKSLLVPIPLAFTGTNRRPYLVMRNETERLANRTWPEWQIKKCFDVKPLPNLSEQLAQLIISLSTGWLSSFAPLSEWDGWDDFKDALRRDSQVLTSFSVVDFSLFIHVLQRNSVVHESSPGLEPSARLDGCIVEPSQAAMVCFAILDYLVVFGAGRKVESSLKSDKFQAYGEKMMHAVGCLGNLKGKDCQAYHDYGTVLEAGNAEAKAALLGSETFRRNYACQVERPMLRYEHKRADGFGIKGAGADEVISTIRVADEPIPKSVRVVPEWSEEIVVTLPEELHGDSWSYNGVGYDPHVASWLQEAVSSKNGGHVVAAGYEQRLDDELGQPGQGFRLHSEELAACKEGIRLFATRSWRGQTSHQDLGNVVWSPSSNSVFVVRGKNWFYSVSKIATEMRKNHCFMQLRFFRCQASDGKRTVFDYKTSFGSLEVLQVMPSASSGADFKIYRKMVKP